MANIDNLNFEVILKDEVFEAKIQKDIKLATDLNVSLSNLLEIKKQVGKIKIESTNIQKEAINQEKFKRAALDTATAQERLAAATTNSATAQERHATAVKNSAAAQKRMETATTNAATAQERLKQAQMRTEQMSKRITKETQKQNNAFIQQNRILREIKQSVLGYLSIHGASQLLSSLVRVTGEFELQKTTLAAMLGDLNQAEQVITRIQGLAVESPFQFKELTTYAKQLSAFSVPAQELYDTTKMLADVSAGLGVGMDRIVLAYGQVRSAAFLRGQEVRQFTEAGIPILDELAKQFSELEGRAVSTGEVFDKISARLVPFEMVAKVFKDMTSEGGKFYNMQEVQAETLRGKISNLKDAYEVMLNEIGSGQSEKLKDAVDWVRRLMQNYEDTGRVLVELIATYGIYKATLIGIEVATNTFVVANHRLIASLVSVGKFLAKNPYMIIAAGITAAGYAIYKNHTELEGYQKVQKAVARTQADYAKEISKEITKLDALYAKLKLAKKGTKEYNEARKEIFTEYAGYISELKAEGVEVENLADIYGNLKNKIEDATKARTSSKAKQRLTDTYDQEIDSYYDRYIEIITTARKQLNRRAKSAGGEYQEFSEFEKAGFWKFVSGSVNMNDLERTKGLERVVAVLNNATIDASADLKLLRKEMQATTAQYNKSLKEIKQAYGEIKGAGGGTISSGIDDGATDEAVKSIKKDIEALQILKKEYEDWKELGVKDNDIAFSLQGYFPNIKAEYGEDFISQLNFATRILEKIKELEKIAPEEAYNLKMSFGLSKSSTDKQDLKGQIKAYEDAAKAAGEYFNLLRKWSAEDFNLNGEGIALDVSKIASDLNEKFNEIDLRARKAKEVFGQIDVDSDEEVAKVKEIFVKEFGADAWEEFWQSYKEKGADAITDLANKQKEYEKKLAQERVNDLAQKYVKESYFEGNIELTDLGDKSLSQIRALKKKLQDLLNAEPLQIDIELKNTLSEKGIDVANLKDVNLDEVFASTKISETDQDLLRLIQSIQKAELSTEDFGEAVKKVFSGDLENLTEEEAKALMKLGKMVSQQIMGIAASLQELGEATGDDQLVSFAKGLQDVGDIANSVMQGFQAGGIAGAIIGGVGSLASKVIGFITEAELATQRANEAARQYAADLKAIEFDNLIEGFDSVFGESSYSKMLKAYELAKRYAEDIKNTSDSVQVSQDDKTAYKSPMSWWANFSREAINTANAVDASGIGDILVDQRSGWQKFWGTGNDNVKLFSISDFFDDDGNLLGEELQAFLNNYGDDISAENKTALETMLGDWELYEQAMAETTSYLSDMFREVAGGMADSFIESFKASGEAALDYADIMDSVATNIAKSVVQSMIVDEIFTPEKVAQVRDLLAGGDEAGAMAVVDEAMKSAQGLTPYIQEFLESMEPYFNMEQDMESQNLGEGIKGITEDTANLLASYLNAIRADVSFSKTLWVRMDANLQRIADIFTSSPTLMEYQAQIAANTYDTAQATQDILIELRSVVATDNGDPGIRVYS